jgi:hypothetical protein
MMIDGGDFTNSLFPKVLYQVFARAKVKVSTSLHGLGWQWLQMTSALPAPALKTISI